MSRNTPTIGILVDRLEDYYQNTFLWSVADTARDRGINLICFAGGILRSKERFAAERNTIYDLVGPENLDGLLIMAGTLGNEVGAAELARFLERFQPLPMCSVAARLEGLPSVLIDNETGIREAVRHLIDSHGAKRIAFVRGPETNEDAEQRYRVYRDVLNERKIPFDPDLVASGDFERESGRQAIRGLVDDRNVRMDALVAASDDMAIGAIAAMRERGICVPEDVAVVSFDDDDEARLCTPPLTTVRAPLVRQVRRAAEILFAMLDGNTVGDGEILHTELVVRESCGCPSRAEAWDSKSKHEIHAAVEAALSAERAQARHRFQVERWARMLSDIGEALITSFNLSSMADSVIEQFPRLGIDSCFLSLYDGDFAPAARSRLILGYVDGNKIDTETVGQTFPSRQLVPRGLLPPRNFVYVVEPLFFEKEQLGFALFEAGPREGNIYESLRDQISAAFKGARLLEQVVEKDMERRKLAQYILDVTPDLHRNQPLADLSESILEQLSHLLGPDNSDSRISNGIEESISPPAKIDGFLAVQEEDSELVVQAGVGRYQTLGRIDERVDKETLAALLDTMGQGEISAKNGRIIIPLRVGDLTLGVVFLDGLEIVSKEIDLIRILSNQATVAIQNIRLYNMATLDPLTGVYSRRFFDRWLLRELRIAFRSRRPLALLMLDVDGLKSINDTAGHLIGDQALSTMGRVLRQATRNNDIVGRYGGDEFAVILPDTDSDGAANVGQRIQTLLKEERIPHSNGYIPLRSSIGLSALPPHQFPPPKLHLSAPTRYFQSIAQSVIQQSDMALYRAKRDVDQHLCQCPPIDWPLP